jgi:hypothetical protein
MTEEELTVENQEQDHQRVKTFTTTQLITRLREVFHPFPTSVHVLFKIESLKRYIIDVSYIRPLIYILDGNKGRKIITAAK